MQDLDFNIDTDGVETEIPYFAPGDLHVRITKVEVVPFKNDTSKRALKLSLTNVADTLGTRGQSILAGKGLATARFNLQPVTENPDAPDFKVDLARLSVAAFGTKRQINAEFVNELPGKEVIAVVKAKRDTSFGDTEVTRVKEVP